MSLNCNEINLILSELNLSGSFIQDIIQPGYDTIALYAYKEGAAKTILICAANNATRINETRRKIPKNEFFAGRKKTSSSVLQDYCK